MDTPDCFFADSDEPSTQHRSPSRLDFCLEEGDESLIDDIDWEYTSYDDNYPYTVIDEDAFAVDIAPLDSSHLLIVHPHESPNPPSMLPEHLSRIPIQPQAPIPVRSPSIQPDIDTQEFAPPSRSASQRLSYPHHGFSRSALLQQKTLWNSRHEEWLEWQSRMEQDQEFRNIAYTGIATAQPSPPPYMRTPPSGLERDLTDHLPKKDEQDAHSTIYPRMGDMSALRDPYSATIDRCFFKYPLWTLHKTLYAFNMNQRSASPVPLPSTYGTSVQASVSSSTLSSYTSSTTDDEESDSTLVADDSLVINGRRPPESSKGTSPPHSPTSWNRPREWELSWHARWELLIGLFHRDRCDCFDTCSRLAESPGIKGVPSLPSTPPYGFTVREDDSDDDEDYGTLISHSSLSAELDEECERALAFYCRESKC